MAIHTRVHLWNFEKLTMEFTYKGKSHLLQGQTKEEVRWVTGQKPKLLSNAVQLFAVHITPAAPEITQEPEEDKEARLEQLLHADIFAEPRGLTSPQKP